MTEFNFTVSNVPSPLTAQVDKTFYWSRRGTTPYFASSIGPLLGDFGMVNNRNIDFVRIASAVLAADRSTSRSGGLSRWNQREISVTVDVLAVTPWQSVSTELESLLAFLTGDIWHLSFAKGRGAAEQIGSMAMDASRIVLMSGGADSGTGALLSALEMKKRGEKHALISHWSSKNLSPVQKAIAADIERLVPGVSSDYIQVNHSRGRKSPSGAAYGKENSTRSRSMLFIALGLALASVNGVELWLPENGYASINPPLSRSRRGSLSTKTTHPRFLQELVRILAKVGAHHNLTNPFADMTKGEMFALVRDAIGVDEASVFLSKTTSCSHTGSKSFHVSPKIACGVCFGCVLRKASFHAAGIPDSTSYLDAAGDKQIQDWLDGKTVIPAMRSFLASSFGESDLTTLRIPENLALADVAELCNRGREELRGLAL